MFSQRRKLTRYLQLPLALAPFGFMVACSHQATEREKINAEAQQMPAVSTGGEFAQQSRKVIEENPSLTSEQKSKLLSLQGQLAGQAAAYRAEMGKLKMLLIKSLMDPKSDNRHVSKIKDRIVDLDRQNVKRMLEGFDEAQKILGRRSYDDERLYRAFLMDRLAGEQAR